MATTCSRAPTSAGRSVRRHLLRRGYRERRRDGERTDLGGELLREDVRAQSFTNLHEMYDDRVVDLVVELAREVSSGGVNGRLYAQGCRSRCSACSASDTAWARGRRRGAPGGWSATGP